MYRLYLGDCREVLKKCPDNYFDSVVTDPPYELGFMGKSWDRAGVSFDPKTWEAIHRVLKPGAYLLSFGGTRTFHRIAVAIEDAGFDIRDSFAWLYGTGFPKGVNIEKALNKKGEDGWAGWNTALKPAFEPIICARKSLDGTLIDNVMNWRTGGINIEACRLEGVKDIPASPRRAKQGPAYGDLSNDNGKGSGWDKNVGRYPPNVALDEYCAGELDAYVGNRPGCTSPSKAKPTSKYRPGQGNYQMQGPIYADSGGPSRFFFTVQKQAKRNAEKETIIPQ